MPRWERKRAYTVQPICGGKKGLDGWTGEKVRRKGDEGGVGGMQNGTIEIGRGSSEHVPSGAKVWLLSMWVDAFSVT